MLDLLLRCGAVVALAASLAACAGNHGPAAPTTNINPQTGSTGSGNGK